jgi:thymidylate synthase (FAD)
MNYWRRLRMQSKAHDPLGDGKSRIQLIDRMGNDLSVVNDAKASFDNHSDELGDREIGLINYLVKERHTSPLRGVVFKFKVKAPLFICRQWWKHVIASAHADDQIGWNEMSFRYVEAKDPGEFYIPSVFRQQCKSNKQGSLEPVTGLEAALALRKYEDTCQESFDAYSKLLELGVGREQARGVLVPAVYTTWVWTTSLQALLNFCDLRKGKGAQAEIALYVPPILEAMGESVPHTLAAWSTESK